VTCSRDVKLLSSFNTKLDGGSCSFYLSCRKRPSNSVIKTGYLSLDSFLISRFTWNQPVEFVKEKRVSYMQFALDISFSHTLSEVFLFENLRDNCCKRAYCAQGAVDALIAMGYWSFHAK